MKKIERWIKENQFIVGLVFFLVGLIMIVQGLVYMLY